MHEVMPQFALWCHQTILCMNKLNVMWVLITSKFMVNKKKSSIWETLCPLVYVWFKSTDTIPWVQVNTVSSEVDRKMNHEEMARCCKSSRCPNGVLARSVEWSVHKCCCAFCERVTLTVWKWKGFEEIFEKELIGKLMNEWLNDNTVFYDSPYYTGSVKHIGYELSHTQKGAYYAVFDHFRPFLVSSCKQHFLLQFHQSNN